MVPEPVTDGDGEDGDDDHGTDADADGDCFVAGDNGNKLGYLMLCINATGTTAHIGAQFAHVPTPF